MRTFDDLDKNILTELSKDSSISIPTLAQKLNSKQSVLYNRIKRLRDTGVIKKFTILVDDKVLGVGVKATIGISRNPKAKAEIHKELELTKEVDEISEVTGRFDIMVHVRAKNLEELHNIVIEKIGKINGINDTETFIDLQKTEKNPDFT
ncbi:MAG: AsnC family transcriptional regulator [Cenarchaeum symbiont of Oopsacas minuta]|nr:AsnC family transcriptional regulator [Cenarchaeum symbiont of Oopsacas minuta]